MSRLEELSLRVRKDWDDFSSDIYSVVQDFSERPGDYFKESVEMAINDYSDLGLLLAGTYLITERKWGVGFAAFFGGFLPTFTTFFQRDKDISEKEWWRFGRNFSSSVALFSLYHTKEISEFLPFLSFGFASGFLELRRLKLKDKEKQNNQ